MADIQVQRYEVNVAANLQTQAITAVGSINNAFVRIVGSTLKGSAGVIGDTGNLQPRYMGVGVQMTAVDELTFYVVNSTLGSQKVFVEVWEYTGAVGGAYEFITRQRGSISMVTTSSVSTSVAGIVNRNNCVPLHQGWTFNNSSTADYEKCTFGMYINASDEIVCFKNNAGDTQTAYYSVVEFTGSAWRVGHTVSSSHDFAGTVGVDLTLNTDSTGIGGSTFDVTDWATAMILDASLGGDSTETGIGDVTFLAEPTSGSTTQVKFSFNDGNARNDSSAYIHVIQCDDLVVNRMTVDGLAMGNNSFGTPITVTGVNASTPLNELSLEWYTCSSGTGAAFPRGFLGAYISAYNTVDHWVGRSGNAVDVKLAIVDFSALVDTPAPTRNRIFLVT